MDEKCIGNTNIVSIVAGGEMVYHHVEACSKVKNMLEILLIGSYDEGRFTRFLDSVFRKLNVKVRYLKEETALGTAGGMRHFKDEIVMGDPELLYILHCDICCTFPLTEMMRFHQNHGGLGTLLGKKVMVDEVQNYGCLVQDVDTREVLHWAEKPETFVSDVINCGIYLLHVDVLDQLAKTGDDLALRRSSSCVSPKGPRKLAQHLFPDFDNFNSLRLEQDVLMPMAGKNKLFVFETGDFWCQIKTPGMALVCAEMYMQRYRYTNTSLLANATPDTTKCSIEGHVFIDPTAEVDPSAKLGPNVSIGAGVRIEAGVRISHSIILEGVTVNEHACILFSIIGWNSTVGTWSRIEGQAPKAYFSTTPNLSLNTYTYGSNTHSSLLESSLVRDVTIFGVSVQAKPEIVVRNCIVLPHKFLGRSYHNEILL